MPIRGVGPVPEPSTAHELTAQAQIVVACAAGAMQYAYRHKLIPAPSRALGEAATA